MALSTIFANLTEATGGQLDQVLAELGALTGIPCFVSGNNVLGLTPFPNTPSVNSYFDYQGFVFAAIAANTGAVIATVGGLGYLNVYTNSGGGPAALVGGEIQPGNLVALFYDGALNSGNGGLHLGIVGGGGGGGGSTARSAQFSIVGAPFPSQPYQVVLTDGGTLPANAAGSVGHAITLPAANWPWVLAYIHAGALTSLGNVIMTTSGAVAFPIFSPVTLVPGDSLVMIAPTPADPTGSDVAWAIRLV